MFRSHFSPRVLCIIVIFLTVGPSADVLADVIHVPSKAAPTIQAGIELAMDGDTVLVAPGTYHEAIDYLGKTITIESEAGPEQTIIDATGLDTSVVTVTSGEGPGTTLRGFTITGGIGTIDDDLRLGGGIYLDGSTLLVDNCIIEECHAADIDEDDSFGGGIAAMNGTDLTVKATTIRNNSAHTGGAIAVLWNGQLHLTDSAIEDNTAGWATGGVVISQNSYAEVHNCSFTGNSSTWAAGLNINVASFAHISQCTFENNHTPENPDDVTSGGGLFVFSDLNTTIVEDSHFIGNSAGRGGGLFTLSGNMVISGCSFINNTAHNVSDWSGVPVWGGGGLLAWDPGLTIENCTFKGNTVISHPGGNNGGGGALVRGGTTITHTVFKDNTLQVESDTINGGGGLRIYRTQETQHTAVKHSTFTNNHAIGTDDPDVETNGGGIYVTDIGLSHGTVDIVHCIFDNNSADYGGAVAEQVQFTVPNISDCTFVGNHANAAGGGLAKLWPYQEVSVSSSTFTGNSAGEVGGAVFTNMGEVSVADSILQNNVAGKEGGAIFTMPDALTAIIANVLCENTPDHVVGPIDDLGGNEFLDECPPAIPGDLTGDGTVGVPDLLILINSWGACDDCDNCPADLTGDCTVGVADLLILIGNWG